MSDQEIIDQAVAILENRLHKPECVITKMRDVAAYLKLNCAALEYESFQVMFLNTKHGLIARKELFHGTIDGASVYPREVVKAALHFNAAAVILAHNHPSGSCEPSQADMRITERIVSALELVDVRVLDHIVVGGRDTFSFAQHGLM